jgi:serine/threonine-protein kinase RsbW
MATRKGNKAEGRRRILARVAPGDFVGRDAELRLVASLAAPASGARNLLVYAAPMAGASELLRQSFDAFFYERGGAAPFYFAFSRKDQTAARAARRFLHTFLIHVVAHRRADAGLVAAPPSLSELTDLVPPSDYEWVERLVAALEKSHEGADERALVRLCLGAPQHAAARGARAVALIDDLHLAAELEGGADLCAAVAQAASQSEAPFVLAGLRRRLSDLIHGSDESHRAAEADVLRLERPGDEVARTIAEKFARALGVAMNAETRDLMVEQLEGNPLFIESLVRASMVAGVRLESYREFQQVYVDDLLGGRINRRFGAALEEVAPAVDARRALVRLLHETGENVEGKTSVEVWRKRLSLEGTELRRLLSGLHARELVNFDASTVEAGRGSAWRDYLRASYRLHVAVEPRALVVAGTLVDALKRAPQTMARYYRRESAAGLRELMARFDHQRVPASLLNNNRFDRAYRGASAEEVAEGLEAETELVRLPQVVHSASCASFHAPMQLVVDEERCAVAHGFDASPYAEAGEVVWIAVEIESKLEAGRALAELWLDRLAQVAQACGFRRARLWLVAPEGFTDDANALIGEREAFGSSRAQLELLAARLGAETAGARTSAAADEFEMIIPMGDETELIAAHTVEQIARRLEFQPEAINQIKHALVEACINAAEHSLSPDRKIYQRFRLEDDKLVVTVSSRGVALSPTATISNGFSTEQTNGSEGAESSRGRRGWGLKLIRTLMDEVEFELVDDGTRLRMTKYLRR